MQPVPVHLFTNLKVTDAAGTGTRMVVADSTGAFTTQAVPTTGTTITGTAVTNDTVYYNGTNWVRNDYLRNTGAQVQINSAAGYQGKLIIYRGAGTINEPGILI